MGLPAPVGLGASGVPPLGDLANAVVSGKLTAVGPGLIFDFAGPFNVDIWGTINTSLATTTGSLSATLGSGTGITAGGSINGANVPVGSTLGTVSGTAATIVLPTRTYWADGAFISSGSPNIVMSQTPAEIVGATISSPYFAGGTTVVSIVQAALPAQPTTGFAGASGIVQLSAVATSEPTNAGLVPIQFALSSASIKSGTDAAALFAGAAVMFTGAVQLEKSFDGGVTWIVDMNSAGTQLLFTNPTTQIALRIGEPELGVLYRVNCTVYSAGNVNYRISATGAGAKSLGYRQLA